MRKVLGGGREVGLKQLFVLLELQHVSKLCTDTSFFFLLKSFLQNYNIRKIPAGSRYLIQEAFRKSALYETEIYTY